MFIDDAAKAVRRPGPTTSAGLLYVTSLYLQEGRGLGALPTAAIMAPMSLGIIIASLTGRGLIESLGRQLVATGLTLVGAGALAFMLTVHGEPNRSWLLFFPLFVCGLGMGCCFGSVFAAPLSEMSRRNKQAARPGLSTRNTRAAWTRAQPAIHSAAAPRHRRSPAATSHRSRD